LSKYRYLGYADVLKVGKKKFLRGGEPLEVTRQEELNLQVLAQKGHRFEKVEDEPKKKGDDK